ncbi:hypothetical protein DsansV1_C06g0066321 [Dioscorea sansibarensis]
MQFFCYQPTMMRLPRHAEIGETLLWTRRRATKEDDRRNPWRSSIALSPIQGLVPATTKFKRVWTEREREIEREMSGILNFLIVNLINIKILNK